MLGLVIAINKISNKLRTDSDILIFCSYNRADKVDLCKHYRLCYKGEIHIPT